MKAQVVETKLAKLEPEATAEPGAKNLRLANLNDVEAILKFCKRLFAGSHNSKTVLNEAKAREQITQFIIGDKKDYIVIISHENDVPVGVICAYAFSPIYTDERVACEVVMWLEEDYRKGRRGIELMDAYEHWAKLVGCKVVQYGFLNSSPAGMQKLYERRGFSPVETLYSKDVT